ncbi:MAG: primosomal protein N' [Acholeplasma sp.]|nr:primosomal protein N' [Acholeplasma sp.]
MFAKVIIDLKTQQIESTYDYIIPTNLAGILKIGMRVYVPFGHQKRAGLVIGISKTSSNATKTILQVLDLSPIVQDHQLKLVDFIASRSFVSKTIAFSLIVPRGLQLKYRKRIKLLDESNAFWKNIIQNNPSYVDEIDSKYYKKLNEAILNQILVVEDVYKERSKIQYEKSYSVLQYPKIMTEKRKIIIKLIESGMVKTQDLIKEGISKSILDALENQKVLTSKLVEKNKKSPLVFIKNKAEIRLTDEQNKAINCIGDFLNSYKRFLLHGVVSSGKTEVFVEIKKKMGHKPILIVVPEIAQVFQLAAYFDLLFDDVYMMHSKLSDQEHYDTWRAIKADKASVIIGTKQTLFLPFKSLGGIVIDECHDGNYIETNQPRYDAIEVAQQLAKLNNIPLILSTATPTVSQYYDSKMGKTVYLSLEKSVMDTNRTIKIVDMKQELLNGNLTMFSNLLKDQLVNQKPDEQSMILVNKRGYASFMMCRECGYVPICETCLTNLVYHKKKNKLICHHCGKQYPLMNSCSVCHSTKIKPVGTGIEQVEQAFSNTFLNKSVVRLDSDTSNKHTLENTLYAFKEKAFNVLIGTQLIAKGHDFDVSLSAVLLAELGLKIPSYLANERTYGLLKQMIGRSGRFKDGLSIIQTYNPNHFVFDALSKPYEFFYDQEIENRRLGNYPPFSNLVQLKFGHANEDMLDRWLIKIKHDLIKTHSQYTVLGPSDAFIHYKNGIFYSNLTIKAPKRLNLTEVFNYIQTKYKELIIDINPYEDFL